MSAITKTKEQLNGLIVQCDHHISQLEKKVAEWNPLTNRNHIQMVIDKVYEEINTAVKFTDMFVAQLRSVYRRDDPHIMYACFDLAFQLTPRELLEAAHKAVKACES